MLPLLVITALINPAFSHQGVTILTYLPSGNPLTLESILYGIYAAFLLITVIAWFSCFNAVMTSDKFMYLSGGDHPGFVSGAVHVPSPLLQFTSINFSLLANTLASTYLSRQSKR